MALAQLRVCFINPLNPAFSRKGRRGFENTLLALLSHALYAIFVKGRCERGDV